MASPNPNQATLLSAADTPLPSIKMLALATLAFSSFFVSLIVRPLLHASPYVPFHDPYYHAAHFTIKDSYMGHNFFDGWKWETLNDPTHGRVNYVDQYTAKQSNLSYATDSKFVMRADAFDKVDPNARGRDSVRITSYNAYDESVIVLDLQHMPEGCSTWPAFWSLSQKGPWPNGGEIDFIEGVNLASRNLASLHTTPQCTMPDGRQQSGQPTSTNCDSNLNYNQGCGVSFAKPASYGSPFNALGGGYYAIVRTSDAVRIWFWSRNEATIPADVSNPSQDLLSGQDHIYPDDSWGTPEAVFPLGEDGMCDYEKHFDPHALVFDLTFCGDWAGTVYSNDCGDNCEAFVNNNPSAFENAYWEINSLRIYTPS
ncbi:hypothetical protein EIP91_003969 [Steccherinum ochraceum]|uniref:GH16 domain-containing protein n=1 Tax=Steccherinum ochraceum TaxID=92696 RepID=A0A4R0RNG6_9APHY|nr:hypothetical protein EIP91_003969 [Steccherinum ochraceum]